MTHNRKRFLRLTSFALAAVVSLGWSRGVCAEPELRVLLDGKQIAYDVPPQVVDSRTMVPLSHTVQRFTGQAPEWDESTKTITFISGGRTCVHTVGTKEMRIDGKTETYDTPSLIIDGRTLVPVRMIADCAGAETTWDAAGKTVIITSKPGASEAKVSTPSILSMTPNAANPATVQQGEAGQITVTANSDTTRLKIVGDTAAAEETVVTDYRKSGANHIFTVRWTPPRLGDNNPRVYPGGDKGFSGSYQTARLVAVTKNVGSVIEAYPSASASLLGDAVTVKIVTNTTVSKVWLNVPQEGDILHATTGYVTSGGRRVWTLSWKPLTAGHKMCAAYASDDRGNQDYYSFNVDIVETAP